jgi:CTP:molybdopterin cytidylyltransferase MocA
MMVEAGFDRVTYHNMTAASSPCTAASSPDAAAGLLASVELGLNRVLRLDSTALPRLAR